MPERILLVDDDPRVRDVLSRFLEREGYVTIPAASGEEALERVAEYPPDLVLLDVQLPGIDGFTVCHALKENVATALIPVTILSGMQDAEARTRGIESGADDFITKPFEYTMLRARIRTQLRIKRLTDQLESTEMVVFSMARWVEIKDPYTEGHLRRIAGYSEQTALALGLPAEQTRVVRYAGVLHDIGKIGIREELLSKPTKLTDEEQTELRKHVEYGAAIVAPMRFAGDVAPIILSHHEHWDGSGYPYGLRGEQIPLGARIISVVDAYDAMTSDRPYRRSLGDDEAVRRLKAGSGIQWDPAVVDVFLSLLETGQLRPVDLPGNEPVVGHLPSYPDISQPDLDAA
ncbi:MAG TPA: HD domain-containing phosphohydrolase [Candidatus Eisenbacteria bacterium]|nr:HD domain-containing phosphohydrolase [Candidatus Eisenbacteria bacterium]